MRRQPQTIRTFIKLFVKKSDGTFYCLIERLPILHKAIQSLNRMGKGIYLVFPRVDDPVQEFHLTLDNVLM